MGEEKFSVFESVSVIKKIDANVSLPCQINIDEDSFFLLINFQSKKKTEFIELSQIKEVYVNIIPQEAKNQSPTQLSSKLVCVSYGCELTNVSNARFSFPTPEIAKKWKIEVTKLLHKSNLKQLSFQDILKKQWKRICHSTNLRGKIPIKKIVKVFGHDKSEKLFFQKANNAGFVLQKNDEIDPSEFSWEFFNELFSNICPRNDVATIFNNICKEGNATISLDDLVTWLNSNQRDPRSNEILVPFFDQKFAASLVSTHEQNEQFRAKNELSLQGFTSYLQSSDNHILYNGHLDVYMDMTKPLSHYFINSSHNTYLTGSQFGGKSSVDIYRSVLLSGCRCVELDCWDGKGDFSGEPIITHGKAMCTDVLFSDVIIAIKETAFVTSQYPVILSFETHCSKPLQKKMAEYCIEIFGDLLLSKQLDSHPLENGVELPSPTDLMNKILIKNKRLTNDSSIITDSGKEKSSDQKPKTNDSEVSKDESEEVEPSIKEVLATEQLTISTEEENNDDETSNLLKNDAKEPLATEEPSNQKCGDTTDGIQATVANESSNKLNNVLINGNQVNGYQINVDQVNSSQVNGNQLNGNQVNGNQVNGNQVNGNHVNGDQVNGNQVNYEHQKTSYTNIHPKLSSIVNYCQPIKFPGFSKNKKESSECKKFHMSSFNETTGLTHLKNNSVEFVDYNKHQLSRIYPNGSRINSSNFTPQPFWDAGCQMVSLNFQTSDVGMQLNAGKFQLNGNCGYLLKPAIMTADNRVFDPFAESTVDGVIAASCKIQVISGLFICEKPLSTYVEVDLYGLPEDTIRKDFKTQTVVNNSLNPKYEHQEFNIRKVICPDMALLRFAVVDATSKQTLGQKVVNFNSLQQGYHHILLQSVNSHNLHNIAIFVKITLASYVPDTYINVVAALENPFAYQTSLKLQREKALQKLLGDEFDDPAAQGEPAHSDVTNKISSNHEPENAKFEEKPAKAANQRSSRKSVTRNEVTSSSKLPGNKVPGNKKQSSDYGSAATPGGKSASDELIANFEANSIKLSELKMHSAYLKMINKKQSTTRIKQKKQQNGLKDSTDQLVPTKFCCSLPFLFCKRHHSLEDKNEETIICQPLDGINENSQYKRALMSALDVIHEQKRKQIVKLHQKETKELNTGQTKCWMQIKKSLMSDHQFREIPKNESLRRVKELQGEEVKKFLEERQQLEMKQMKQLNRFEEIKNEKINDLLNLIVNEEDYN